MITVNKWKVKVEGDKSTLISEYSVISKCLMEECEIKKEDLVDAIEKATMTEEELKTEVLKTILNMVLEKGE